MTQTDGIFWLGKNIELNLKANYCPISIHQRVYIFYIVIDDTVPYLVTSPYDRPY
jgi:hypothetical protein